MCHLANELRKGGNVWSLLCKMEMSLPRFAVAKLFWNGSHRKTLGRAGKLGHLQEQGSAFFSGRRAVARAKTEEPNCVALFIQGSDGGERKGRWGGAQKFE